MIEREGFRKMKRLLMLIAVAAPVAEAHDLRGRIGITASFDAAATGADDGAATGAAAPC